MLATPLFEEPPDRLETLVIDHRPQPLRGKASLLLGDVGGQDRLDLRREADDLGGDRVWCVRVRDETVAEDVEAEVVAITSVEERGVRAAETPEPAQARKEDRALGIVMSEQEAPCRERLRDERVERDIGRCRCDGVNRSS